MPPALVIFDCDGVLVDSEPVACRVLSQLLNRHGVACDEAAVHRRFVGRSMASVVALLAAEDGFAAPEGFVAEVRTTTFDALEREGIEAIPGVADALDRIAAAGLASCVASSGLPEKMRLTLGLAGLLPRFEGRLYSAVQVARGKPAPDVFLFAAERMGRAPADCLVVEDSLAGLEAARAAGMAAVAYAAAPGSDRAAMARLAASVIDDMAALPEAVGL